jgi:putative endonuclease
MAETKSQHLVRGQLAEDLAERYLTALGFDIRHRNYRCKQGEIDLIARQGQSLHFIEVKGRWTNRMGRPLEQVTRWKMRQVARAAQHFLLNQSGLKGYRLYFSVIGVDAACEPIKIDWVPDAFEIPG